MRQTINGSTRPHFSVFRNSYFHLKGMGINMNTNTNVDVSHIKPINKRTNFRWNIAFLALGAIAINYIDRSVIGTTAPTLMKVFNFGPAEMGFLMSAFFISYTLFQIPAGWLADRVGQRLIMGVSVAWWSLSTMMPPFCRNLTSLVGSRMLMGIGEAAAYPVVSGVVAKWFPDKERSRATVFFDVGNKIGSAVGMPLVAWIVVEWGWKMPFLVLGTIGLIWTILWFLFYTDPEKSKYANKEEIEYIRSGQSDWDGGDQTQPLKWYQLFRYRIIWVMCIGLFMLNYGIYFFITWFPTYLVQARGMTLLTMGFVAMIPILVAMVAAIGAALVSDRFYNRGVSKTKIRKVNIVAGMILAASVGLASFVQSDIAAISLLSLSYSGLAIAGAAIWTLPGDIAPRNMTSSVGAVQNFVGNMGGFLGPIVTGYILTKTHSFMPALIVTSAAALIGACVYAFFLGEVKHIEID